MNTAGADKLSLLPFCDGLLRQRAVLEGILALSRTGRVDVVDCGRAAESRMRICIHRGSWESAEAASSRSGMASGSDLGPLMYVAFEEASLPVALSGGNVGGAC